ncbi:hypothetical protein RISK_002151 [Rhodopirellula islandica]|uniref:Uncharacterized protein n=1 Tax=Rhodopirellula islandica TaxID=595434 RepID=A0A0J1EJ16_RHOIS|nr:hypothetical protein RISK_002151 [Rhodopirellula islandica]
MIVATTGNDVMHRTPEKQVQQQCHGGDETTKGGHGFSVDGRMQLLSVVRITKTRSKTAQEENSTSLSEVRWTESR